MELSERPRQKSRLLQREFLGAYWLSRFYWIATISEKRSVIMRELVWVFIGGGLGSICRYAITILLKETDSLYPWPTLLANAIGSLLIGVLADQLMRSTSVQSANALFWIIGFCGGLTTFSAFALENLTLFRTSSGISLLIYASLTYFVCLGMVVLGTSLSKLIF